MRERLGSEISRLIPSTPEAMQSTMLSFENLHQHGELFANILRARRQSFIIQNRWNLPEALGMEFDQYDTPASRWLAVHEAGLVYGGLRLTPTTARCAVYSYMLRDAQRGLLDSLPTDILYEEAPVDDSIWEVTRGFVVHEVPASLRATVRLRLVREMVRAARELGIAEFLALLPTNWHRWAARCNLAMRPAGPVVDLDGIDYQAVHMTFAPKVLAI